jgi:hypothetical protein
LLFSGFTLFAADPTASVNLVRGGPAAGSVAVTVSWEDCTDPACNGIAEVEIVIKSESPAGVARADVKKSKIPPPAILLTGSWAETIGGLTTGDRITKVEVIIWGDPKIKPALSPQMVSSDTGKIRITVP